MILRISFKSKNASNFRIPIDYANILQAFIYKNITEELGTFFHNEGFAYEKRSFKMFSFSRLISKYKRNIEDKTMTFENPVHFYLTTVVSELVESFGSSLLMKDDLWIGKEQIEITEVKASPVILPESNVVLRTVSPISVYSTFQKPDGKKVTMYYEPGDQDFNEQITQNLIKKYQAFYGKEITGVVKLKPLGKVAMHRSYYKGFPIKGVMGRFKAEGTPALIKIGMEAGFGSKGSQGFGCVLLERR